MKTTSLQAALVLAMVGLTGCSGSDVIQVSESPTGETLGAAAIKAPLDVAETLASSPTPSPFGSTNESSSKSEAFRNPFAPPTVPPLPPIVEAPEPEPEISFVEEPTPEIRQPGTPPKIRLLGFLNIGEPKALISFRDDLETLAIGDTLEDMKVVQIESPELTMLFEDREIKLSLFDQAWRHETGTTAAGNNSRAKTPPLSTRSTGQAAASTSVDVKTSTPTPGASIPGFAPDAGKPPGFRPSALPSTGPPPEPPVGTPPPSLPGLTSEIDGIVPGDIPALDGDVVTGKPAAGNLPVLPHRL